MKKRVFVVLVVVIFTLLVVGIALPHWWEVDGSDNGGRSKVSAEYGLWRYCWEVRAATGDSTEKECGDALGNDSAKLNRSIDAVAGLVLTVVVLHVLSVVVFAGGYGERQRERVRLTAVMQVLAVVLGCTALGMASHAASVMEVELSGPDRDIDLDVTFGDSFILATTATIVNGMLAAAVVLFLCHLTRLEASRGQPLGGYVGDGHGDGPLAAYGEEGSVQDEEPGGVR